MNKYQKILTVLALVAFLLLRAGHYFAIYFNGDYGGPYIAREVVTPAIENVWVAWFMLGVTYGALLLLLRSKKVPILGKK